ncbi:hypothetical protein C5167_050236 [Papaver somniferum]|uniref:Reverse transcriptase zinc-binding domain-containing protein n=1 Tax=Papaver somniferum TaxID=3469 RepID=A0A4Y7KN29_PAPSO|nr:hypothetical protein C5167_050236 [Papaver somniferum]
MKMHHLHRKRSWLTSVQGNACPMCRAPIIDIVQDYPARYAGLVNFAHYFIYKSAVPPKINQLMWCLDHNKLNSVDVLQHKGVQLCSSCSLYDNDVETMDH